MPGPRRLRRGDLVKLDVTAELDAFYADACVTVPVGPIAPRSARVLGAAQAALRRGLAATHDAPVRAISQAIADEAARRGVSPLEDLGGHGIGRTIHEPPSVPNTPDALAAHVEHTIVVTGGRPLVLTA